MDLTLKKLLDMPPLWLALFAVLVWGLGRVLPGTDMLWLRGLGTGLVVAGVTIILLASVQFRQHRTTIIPHQTASALLTSGLYAWSRNPIYLADAVILTGLCLRWGVLGGLLLVPVFVWILQKRFILPEEARLSDGFGAEFAAYRTRTRRWL